MNLENNDELEKFKSYMLERFLELERDSCGTVWDFVGLSVSLDYLASLNKIKVKDKKTGKLRLQYGNEYFTSFINIFFPENILSSPTEVAPMTCQSRCIAPLDVVWHMPSACIASPVGRVELDQL